MEEELEVLEAILGDALHLEKEALKLTIKVNPMLLRGQVNKIIWQSDKLTEAKVEAEVENMPPVMLLVQLSPSYPALAPPEARVMSDWLPLEEISKLERLLCLLWERAGGQVVIWDWVQVGVCTVNKNYLLYPAQEVQEQLEILLQHGLELVDR